MRRRVMNLEFKQEQNYKIARMGKIIILKYENEIVLEVPDGYSFSEDLAVAHDWCEHSGLSLVRKTHIDAYNMTEEVYK
jgi:hypothetical protein